MSQKYYSSAKGYSDFKLLFPAIDRNTKSFDCGEANGGSWFITDIQLKPAPSHENNVLFGNWYNINSGDWEFSLLDTAVVYKNSVWSYSGFNPEEKKGTIILGKDSESLVLNYKCKGKQLFLGESTDNMNVLDRDSRYHTVADPTNPPVFKKPVLKPDTAIVKGYCYGFSTKMSSRTATIYVDNILTDKQNNHLVKIEDDGTFKVEIPTLHPQEVYVRMQGNAPRLYLEPGKEVFVLLNFKSNESPLIMGANARLMSELMNLKWDNYYMSRFYREIYNNILDMSAEEYKLFCMMKKEDDLAILRQNVKQYNLSDKYNQVMEKDIRGFYNRNVLHYHYTSESAYRKKHKIPRSQRTLPVTFEVPSDPEFYHYLSTEYMNDELSLLGNSYGNLMNAFIYSPIFRTGNHYFPFLNELNNYADLTEDEKQLVADIQKNITPGYIELQAKYNRKYWRIEREFNKYTAKVQNIPGYDSTKMHILNIINYFSESDTLPEKFKIFCEDAVTYYSNPEVLNAQQFFFKSQ
jgi:hypothetical protein